MQEAGLLIQETMIVWSCTATESLEIEKLLNNYPVRT
jgi:hypothetical protein